MDLMRCPAGGTHVVRPGAAICSKCFDPVDTPTTTPLTAAEESQRPEVGSADQRVEVGGDPFADAIVAELEIRAHDGRHPVSDDVVGSKRVRPLWFAGAERLSPHDLAAAFQANWSEAMNQLMSSSGDAYRDEVGRFLRAHGRKKAAATAQARASSWEIDKRFAELLVQIDPGLSPVFNGVLLTQGGLLAAAKEILAANGEHVNATILEEVRNHGILSVWQGLSGMTHARAIQDAWVVASEDLETAFGKVPKAVRLTDAEVNAARALLLCCVIDPDGVGTVTTKRVRELDPSTAGQQSWWERLHSGGRRWGLLVATLTTHRTAEQHTLQERVEQAAAAQEEADRQRQAEDEIRQAEDARRDREQQDRRLRLNEEVSEVCTFAFLALVFWLFLFGIVGSCLCLWRLWVIRRDYGAEQLSLPIQWSVALALAIFPFIVYPILLMRIL